ncbi:zinc finger CCCH domain-containing protein 53 isoform X2 [Cornus florida]|uniref:zinc finger CCCH domain-containing protein 53 isoform X2 n=1 Tax=Cornus florida TaxID=4283 RepID=UPI00289835D0|nr:zinc finger CCCH domain-containing protein 53 isoform X2 [Cornus florida]
MDAYEATRIVFSRIQNLDPENASKIMGLLLIQDHGEKEMIRLAFGPEALVHSVILKARKELGLSSNTPSTPSTPSSPSPFLSNNNPISLSRQNSSSSPVPSWLPGGGGRGGGINLPSPLSIPNPSSSPNWAAFSDFPNPEDLISPSSSSTFVAASSNTINSIPVGATSSASMNSSASPFYGSGGTDLIDEFQLQDQLSFLNDGSPTLGPKSSDLYYPQPDLASSPGNGGELFPSYGGAANWGGLPHRRSCSVSDICLGSDDPSGGFGWKPCLYFARGYCKNGNSCRFLHDNLADPDGASMVGSPSKLEMMEQCQELLRSKSAHQQRFAAASQLMGSSSFPYSPSSSNKCMNFLLQQQQSDSQRAAAAMIMGEDMHKFGRSRLERNDFSMNGGVGMMNSSSRQIYLTFPADSTFREEDVSNYFSNYGPVQDVRIPYQQKRMFGFVTFVYPETVKIILAKGNPHFVCDARVLVKPYKEKGKVPDKKQQMERGEFSACGSPTGLDSRDPYDFQLGARMFYNTQQMLWKRKLEEQADLQQAIELQGRRLMGLQLLDVKRQNHHRTLSTGGAIPSPTQSPNFFNQTLVLPPDRSSPEIIEENGSSPVITNSSTAMADQQSANVTEKEKDSSSSGNDGSDNGKESPHHEESDIQESLEHNLPDSPFASPKAPGDYMTAFSNAASEAEESAVFPVISAANGNLITSSLLPATSTLDMANSFKSCYFQVPRFSSGQGAIEM